MEKTMVKIDIELDAEMIVYETNVSIIGILSDKYRDAIKEKAKEITQLVADGTIERVTTETKKMLDELSGGTSQEANHETT